MSARIDTEAPQTDATGPLLTRLGQPSLDPVDFLNDVLPTVNLSSQAHVQKTTRSAQIQSTSTDTIALLSSLNGINIRASSDLGTLTDEIIRSGNRLAYEVEVLRGDVNGLHELLTDSLKEDIGHFVQTQAVNAAPVDSSDPDVAATAEAQTLKNEPDFMTQLRLLGKVKKRLEAVVSAFGEAMKWPIPPSEVSGGSSLISVSAPELGMQSTAEDDKAREVLRGIRAEINDLLVADGGSYRGLEAAARRVEEYKDLVLLWKGTNEERARVKFVDTLARLVDDRRKILDASRNTRAEGALPHGVGTGKGAKGSSEGGGAAGLFRNLQRLKDDLYLE
ncbi:hypothetical protein EDD37DRAFT_645123 [Exophiala viscosa]|uniref:Uncharacterized protein n=1 Tax=Exophiala viscosa TaxID=2486360 RepID=A0AAN6E384_9EURO|nr:hypothetical protein EDD36DRAFT_153718 [Exophiala viscosa]KAI1629366.1 hypothetical protein EDD37DRAFT_645123 [Exophiala viscosa]